MTKLKCSNCEEIEDLINMTCECSDCYMKGAVKEQLRERERIKELIKTFKHKDKKCTCDSCATLWHLEKEIDGEK